MHPSSLAGRARRRGSISIALTAALALAGSLGASAQSEAPAASVAAGSPGAATSITVGVIPILDVAPIYLGVQQGFFADQGLALTLETAQGGAAIVPGVVSGQFQFGFSNVVSLLLATSNGIAVQGVGSGVASTGVDGADFGAVVVPADSAIATAADLAGKKVAVNTLNNINTTTINKVVRDAGGDPTTIEYVELPFPEIAPAVARRDVDAGQVVEPFLTIGQGQGLRQITSNYALTDPDLMVAMYFTSADYAAQHPDVVAAFSTALGQSLAYADANPDAVRAILAEYTQIEESVRAAVTLPRWPAEIDRDTVTLLADLAVQDGLLTAVPDLTTLLP